MLASDRRDMWGAVSGLGATPLDFKTAEFFSDEDRDERLKPAQGTRQRLCRGLASRRVTSADTMRLDIFESIVYLMKGTQVNRGKATGSDRTVMSYRPEYFLLSCDPYTDHKEYLQRFRTPGSTCLHRPRSVDLQEISGGTTKTWSETCMYQTLPICETVTDYRFRRHRHDASSFLRSEMV